MISSKMTSPCMLNGLLLCNSGVQVNGCCIDSAFYTIPKLKATF